MMSIRRLFYANSIAFTKAYCSSISTLEILLKSLHTILKIEKGTRFWTFAKRMGKSLHLRRTKDLNMWLLALDYFAKEASGTENSKLDAVLNEIQNRSVASLVQVIHRLAQTDINIGAVSAHIVRVLDDERNQLEIVFI